MPTRRQHGTWWTSTRAMSHHNGRRLRWRFRRFRRITDPIELRKPQSLARRRRVHQLQCRVGSSSGTSETNFRNAIAYGTGQSAGVGFASAIVTSLFASGYCRAWSSANGVNPARLGVGRAAGTSVVASVNPYLTGRGASSGSSDAQMISYAKGAGKSKGNRSQGRCPQPSRRDGPGSCTGRPSGWSSEARGILLAPVHHRGPHEFVPTLTEKDKTLGRGMLAAVEGPDGIRTRISSNSFGSKTMLRTRNGMPEFTTVQAQEGTDTSQRGFVAYVRGSRYGALFDPYTLEVLDPKYRLVGALYSVQDFATGWNVSSTDTTHWCDTIVLTARSSRSTRRRCL